MHLHCYTTITTFHLQTSFILQNWNSGLIKNDSPLSPLPTPDNHILVSIAMNLTTLGTSYRWNHMVFIFFVTGLFHFA